MAGSSTAGHGEPTAFDDDRVPDTKPASDTDPVFGAPPPSNGRPATGGDPVTEAHPLTDQVGDMATSCGAVRRRLAGTGVLRQ